MNIGLCRLVPDSLTAGPKLPLSHTVAFPGSPCWLPWCLANPRTKASAQRELKTDDGLAVMTQVPPAHQPGNLMPSRSGVEAPQLFARQTASGMLLGIVLLPCRYLSYLEGVFFFLFFVGGGLSSRSSHYHELSDIKHHHKISDLLQLPQLGPLSSRALSEGGNKGNVVFSGKYRISPRK